MCGVSIALAAEIEKPYLSGANKTEFYFLLMFVYLAAWGWQKRLCSTRSFRDPSWHKLCHLWHLLPRSLWVPASRGKWRRHSGGSYGKFYWVRPGSGTSMFARNLLGWHLSIREAGKYRLVVGSGGKEKGIAYHSLLFLCFYIFIWI